MADAARRCEGEASSGSSSKRQVSPIQAKRRFSPIQAVLYRSLSASLGKPPPPPPPAPRADERAAASVTPTVEDDLSLDSVDSIALSRRRGRRAGDSPGDAPVDGVGSAHDCLEPRDTLRSRADFGDILVDGRGRDPDLPPRWPASPRRARFLAGLRAATQRSSSPIGSDDDRHHKKVFPSPVPRPP